MRKGLIIAVILLILAGIAYQFYRSLEMPTVTVDDISAREISEETMTLDVRVIVHNPNPVGADVSLITFDLFFFENNDTQRYLGHGEKKNIRIRKKGDTTFTIPVVIENLALVRAAHEATSREEVTMKVSGSVFLRLLFFEIEIPFERTQRVELESETPAPSIGIPVTPGATPAPSITAATPAPSPAQSERPSPTPSGTANRADKPGFSPFPVPVSAPFR